MKKVDNKSAAIEIIQKLREKGHIAYLVGGCVRDMLIGRKNPKEEHDVATCARIEEVIQIFPRTLSVGAKFGVVLVGIHRHWIEVASFRSDESYTDGRHPDAVRIGSISEDAQRRDFTINGIYYDPIEDKLIDLVNGQSDIEKKIIRAIGAPEERFTEDHLRMLRAVRFTAQLHDFQIEQNTAAAITKLADKITKISAERILEELKKMLTAFGRTTGLKNADKLGLLKYILPEISPLLEKTLAVLENLPQDTRFETVMAAMLVNSEQPIDLQVRARMSPNHYSKSAKIADAVCRRLTCSNDERLAIVWLVHLLPIVSQAKNLKLSHIKRLMIYNRFEPLLTIYKARVEANLESKENLSHIEALAKNISPESLEAPPLITGEDLTNILNLTPSPIYQQILESVYDAQLNEEIKTKVEAIALAKKFLDPKI